MAYLPLIAIGLVAGVLAGMFGIGGGLVIVPALLYFIKLSEVDSIGTSLAALIPPVNRGRTVRGRLLWRTHHTNAAAIDHPADLRGVSGNRGGAHATGKQVISAAGGFRCGPAARRRRRRMK
jgi:hypothetical protein